MSKTMLLYVSTFNNKVDASQKFVGNTGLYVLIPSRRNISAVISVIIKLFTSFYVLSALESYSGEYIRTF